MSTENEGVDFSHAMDNPQPSPETQTNNQPDPNIEESSAPPPAKIQPISSPFIKETPKLLKKGFHLSTRLKIMIAALILLAIIQGLIIYLGRNNAPIPPASKTTTKPIGPQ
jgi:hypothetical protein